MFLISSTSIKKNSKKPQLCWPVLLQHWKSVETIWNQPFTVTVARRGKLQCQGIRKRETNKQKNRLPILLSFISCTVWQRVWEGAFRLFRERHKLGPHILKHCQLVIQLMHSRCCILIALPDDWWIGVSPPIQNKPLGTTKYKRGPYREKMHLRTGLEKLCTDAHVQMHISDGFLLISMQQIHLVCCLEESQQTRRNTCVISVLSPCEYDFHPHSFAVFCSHWDPFQSPLGHA